MSFGPHTGECSGRRVSGGHHGAGLMRSPLPVRDVGLCRQPMLACELKKMNTEQKEVVMSINRRCNACRLGPQGCKTDERHSDTVWASTAEPALGCCLYSIKDNEISDDIGYHSGLEILCRFWKQKQWLADILSKVPLEKRQIHYATGLGISRHLCGKECIC